MSSAPYAVPGPKPPGMPSVSTIALTQITFGLFAGEEFAASTLLLPAATT